MAGVIERLRAHKVGGMAAFDWAATAAFALGVARARDRPFAPTFAWLVVAAVSVHAALGVPTQLNAYLGINPRLR